MNAPSLNIIYLCSILFLISTNTFSQEIDTDNDGIINRLDIDDDNDGLIDTTECPPITGATTPHGDAISWSKNKFDVFAIGNNTTGLGYKESGFEQEIFNRGQALTVLDGTNNYIFPPSSTIDGSGSESIGTFSNGTLDFEDNYIYRSYEIDEFRATTAGTFISGNTGSAVYVYPEVGNQTGDYYTVNINFTEPVASFSFDFVDAYDTNDDGAVINYEVYADGELVAYFSDAYLGSDATGNVNLYDADGIFKGALGFGQNIETTVGFVTNEPVSVVSIRHIVISGSLATATHDPHGLDTFAYSFLCKAQIDIDVDKDGIPDNIEGQPTASYIYPSGTVNTTGPYIGLWDNYGTGITPEDTDGDLTYDYLDLDTDNDGIPDIEENGMANISSNNDTDKDGLDDSFENSNINDPYDSNDEIDDPTDLSILPDTDEDLAFGGDLDYRDDLGIHKYEASLDFDGVDDYLTGNSILNGLGELTIMAWIKIDPANVGTSNNTIAGEDLACRLYVQDGNKLLFGTHTSANITSISDGGDINYNEWHHITGTFSATSGTQSIYIDGKLIDTNTNSIQIGEAISNTAAWNGKFEVGRYSNTAINKQYFDGEIDELRIFGEALTEDQIQRIIYQEIKQNSNFIKGTVIDRDIIDSVTNQKIAWTNLLAYFPMTNIVNSEIEDHSMHTNTLLLRNITTLQDQTAPMPYETNTNGPWTNESTWLHGDVWDIEDVTTNKDWSIVNIKNNVNTTNSHKHLGLIIDNDKTLTINNDNSLVNTWYLDLNGIIDLQGESQLVQTTNSELTTSSSGKILRSQEGQSNVYRYNYWSAPVSTINTTANNTGFSLNMLKDTNGHIQFTTNHNPSVTTPSSISTAWTYTFENGVTYYDWNHLDQTSIISSGIGYSQKGTGQSGQYIFEGKPNNGDINIAATDTGGSGSVLGISKTSFLLGNPYPSAIDVHKFIDDNASIIGGEIYLWEQWTGESHVTVEYQGGYAIVNKLAGVRAYQILGNLGGNTGSQDGTKTPTRYIPVGQGFFTEIENNGMLKFKNSQRVFIKESDADGAYNNGSVFFKNKANSIENETITFQKIRLQFNTSNNLSRELVLGFSDSTSDDFDYGYDANIDNFNESDLATILEGKKYAIQAFSPIHDNKEIDLALNSDANLSYTISMIDTENIDQYQEIYLWDVQENIYHDLRTGDYSFTALTEENTTRFKIVFNAGETLSNPEYNLDSILIYVNNTEDKLYIKGLNENVKKLHIVNILGQTVMEYKKLNSQKLNQGLATSKLSSGVYIINLELENGAAMAKKIIIN